MTEPTDTTTIDFDKLELGAKLKWIGRTSTVEVSYVAGPDQVGDVVVWWGGELRLLPAACIELAPQITHERWLNFYDDGKVFNWSSLARAKIQAKSSLQYRARIWLEDGVPMIEPVEVASKPLTDDDCKAGKCMVPRECSQQGKCGLVAAGPGNA